MGASRTDVEPTALISFALRTLPPGSKTVTMCVQKSSKNLYNKSKLRKENAEIKLKAGSSGPVSLAALASSV